VIDRAPEKQQINRASTSEYQVAIGACAPIHPASVKAARLDGNPSKRACFCLKVLLLRCPAGPCGGAAQSGHAFMEVSPG